MPPPGLIKQQPHILWQPLKNLATLPSSGPYKNSVWQGVAKLSPNGRCCASAPPYLWENGAARDPCIDFKRAARRGKAPLSFFLGQGFANLPGTCRQERTESKGDDKIEKRDPSAWGEPMEEKGKGWGKSPRRNLIF